MTEKTKQNGKEPAPINQNVVVSITTHDFPIELIFSKLGEFVSPDEKLVKGRMIEDGQLLQITTQKAVKVNKERLK